MRREVDSRYRRRPRVPRQIVGLEAANAKDGIRLTWDRPENYAGGAKMKDLGSFSISRAEEGKPAEKIGDIQVHDQGRFQVQNTFTFIDGDDRCMGKTYHYQVTSSTTDGYVSEPSNDVDDRAQELPRRRRIPTLSWCRRPSRSVTSDERSLRSPFIRRAAL